MRSLCRTTLVLTWSLFAAACSSLGGIELQGGDEGRFTAGEDVDPPDGDGDDGDRPPVTSDGDDGSSGGDDHDDPLTPRPDTSGTDDGESSSSGAQDDGSGTDGEPAPDDTSEGDGGTTSPAPTNGDTRESSTGDTDDCTDAECLPACDPTWDTWCGQPCAEAESACAAEGGIVVSCDAGTWTCADAS